MRFRELDADKLVEVILRTPLLSRQLSHKQIESTLRDYIHPIEGDLEIEFLRDLFTLSTEEIVDKWYGGDEGRKELFHQLFI